MRSTETSVGVKEMSKDTTIRIDLEHKEILKELSRKLGVPASTVMQQAIEQYHRSVVFEDLDRAYIALRADKEAWAEELEERKLWESTLGDGLD